MFLIWYPRTVAPSWSVVYIHIQTRVGTIADFSTTRAAWEKDPAGCDAFGFKNLRFEKV